MSTTLVILIGVLAGFALGVVLLHGYQQGTDVPR
jgi:hypothetical protein